MPLRGIDPPNWSLSVEGFFYLIFPFIGTWLWTLKGKSLIGFAATLWFGSQVAIYFLAPHIPGDVVKLNPLLHVSTFILGILLAKWQSLVRVRGSVDADPFKSPFLSISIAAIGFVAVVSWLPKFPYVNLWDGLMAPIFCCIIWTFSVRETFLTRILSAKWIVVLGEASFGLYLIHIPVYHVYQRLHLENTPSTYPIFLVTCIALSVLSFYFVESPSRRWILHRSHTRPKETMELASDAQ